MAGADATAKLEPNGEQGQVENGIPIVSSFFAKGPVEVDDVQPGCAGVEEVSADFNRLIAENSLLIGITVFEAHYFACAKVNGWVNGKCHSATKFLRICSPIFWLFSP